MSAAAPADRDDHATQFSAQLTSALAGLRTISRRSLSEPLVGAVPIIDIWSIPGRVA